MEYRRKYRNIFPTRSAWGENSSILVLIYLHWKISVAEKKKGLNFCQERKRKHKLPESGMKVEISLQILHSVIGQKDSITSIGNADKFSNLGEIDKLFYKSSEPKLI